MQRQRAFTMIELLLVVAIIGILVSLLIPALTQARNTTQGAVCMAKMRGTGQSMRLYTVDYKLNYPPRADFMNNKQPFTTPGNSASAATKPVLNNYSPANYYWTFLTGDSPNNFAVFGSGATWMHLLADYQADEKAYLCPSAAANLWGFHYGMSEGFSPVHLKDTADFTAQNDTGGYYYTGSVGGNAVAAGASPTSDGGFLSRFPYGVPKNPTLYASSPATYSTTNGNITVAGGIPYGNGYPFPRAGEEPFNRDKILLGDSGAGRPKAVGSTFLSDTGEKADRPAVSIGTNYNVTNPTRVFYMDWRHGNNTYANSLMADMSVRPISGTTFQAMGNSSSTESLYMINSWFNPNTDSIYNLP